MIDPVELVRQVPEGTTFTREAVLDLLRRAGEIEEGTPSQVARRLGRSPKYWRAHAPEVDGAYREDSGRWHLPLAACRAYLSRKRARSLAVRRGPRAPWKQTAAPASADRAGATPLPTRPVLVGRSQTVERAESAGPRPTPPGLAYGRRENR